MAGYAMRLLAGSGFPPVAYLAILPTNDVGHTVALLQQGGTYYVISNKTIEPLELQPASSMDAMLMVLRDYAIKDAYGAPPAPFEVYVGIPGPKGEMPAALPAADESARRRDLEPVAAAPAAAEQPAAPVPPASPPTGGTP